MFITRSNSLIFKDEYYIFIFFITDSGDSYGKVFKTSLFAASFIEGNPLNTLEVICSQPMEHLIDHSLLINFACTESSFTYRLASTNRLALQKILHAIENDSRILRVQFTVA